MKQRYKLAIIVPAVLVVGWLLAIMTAPNFFTNLWYSFKGYQFAHQDRGLIGEIVDRRGGENDLTLEVPKYTLKPGDKKSFSVIVPPSRLLTIIYAHGAEKVVFTTPDGRQFNPSKKELPAGARFEEIKTSGPWKAATMLVDHPATGLWKVAIDATMIKKTQPDYEVSFFATSDTTIHFDFTSPEHVSFLGQESHLAAWVETKGQKDPAITWELTADGQPFALYDDGKHGDGLANDGEFGASFSSTSKGDHTVNATVILPSGARAQTAATIYSQ